MITFGKHEPENDLAVAAFAFGEYVEKIIKSLKPKHVAVSCMSMNIVSDYEIRLTPPLHNSSIYSIDILIQSGRESPPGLYSIFNVSKNDGNISSYMPFNGNRRQVGGVLEAGNVLSWNVKRIPALIRANFR